MNISYDSATAAFYAPCVICGRRVSAHDDGWAVFNEANADHGRIPIEIMCHANNGRCLARHEARFGQQPDHRLDVVLTCVALDLGITPKRLRELVVRYA